MLKITLIKIKKAWLHSLALASRGRSVTKILPGKFHKQLVVTTAQKSTSTGKDSDSRCEKCEQIIKYIFNSNSTANDYQKLQETIGIVKKPQGSTIITVKKKQCTTIHDESKTQDTNSEIQKVHDTTIVNINKKQGTTVDDAQTIQGSIVDSLTIGKTIGKVSRNEETVHQGEILEPKVSMTNADTLQSTTVKETEEKLAQKIENIEETPLVEAETQKIESFNTPPRVLGDLTDINKNNSHRLYSNKMIREAMIKEKLIHKIESLVRKIENSLISENISRKNNNFVNFATNESNQNDKSGPNEMDKKNSDSIAKRSVGSSANQIDARLVRGMKQLGVPGTSGNSTIEVQMDKSKQSGKPIKKAEIELEARKFEGDPPNVFSAKQNVESVEKVHLTFQAIPDSTNMSHRDKTTLKGEIIRYSDQTASIKEDKKATKADKAVQEMKVDAKTNGEQLIDIKDQNKSLVNQTPESYYPKMTPYGMWYPNFQSYYLHHNGNFYHGYGYLPQNFWLNNNPHAYEYEQTPEKEPNDKTADQKVSQESQTNENEPQTLRDQTHIYADQKTPLLATESGPILDSIQNPEFIVSKPEETLTKRIAVKPTYKEYYESLSNPTKKIELKYLETQVPSPKSVTLVLTQDTPHVAIELRPILNDIQSPESVVNTTEGTVCRTDTKLTECIAVKPTYKDFNESISNLTKNQNDLKNEIPSPNLLTYEYPTKAQEPPFSLYGNFFENQNSATAKQTAENQARDDKPTKQYHHMQKLQQSQCFNTEQKAAGELIKDRPQVSSTYKTLSADIKTPILATELKPIFSEIDELRKEHVEAEPAEAKTKKQTLSSIPHHLSQTEFLVNPLTKEPSPAIPEKTQKTSSATADPLEDINTKDDKIPLSEMLRRVRLRSHMELATQIKKVDRIKGKCGTPKPPCPPPSPTCPSPPPPRPSPCPPPDPPCPKPCKPRGCPPPCSPSKPPEKPCCKMVSVRDTLKKIFAQLWDFGSIRFPYDRPVCIKRTFYCQTQSIEYSTKAVLTEEVEVQLRDWGCHMLTRYRCLGKCYWRLETFAFARSFEPWVPIPSWPIPKKQEKKKLVCPKEGCKTRPPPRYGAPCESPCYPGNPCLGFPNTFRKHFLSADIIYDENGYVHANEYSD